MADHPYLSGNALVCGDNIDVLRELPDECVDLIYLDPPFNSNQFYVAAFGDKGGLRGNCAMLRVRMNASL